MKRTLRAILILSLVVVGLLGTASVALAGEQPEKGPAFVCPVIPSEAMGQHNPNAVPLGDTGTYTVGPPTGHTQHLNVPVHATNGDGDGVPGGPQSEPGDTDYTAIWHK